MISLHAGLAYMTGEPAWNLDTDEGEAKEYAKALRGVSRHYGIRVSAKMDSFIALGAVAGKIYFRRMQYFSQRKAAAPPPDEAPASVSTDASPPPSQPVLVGGLAVVPNIPGG